jgi:hypothetical protein
MTFSVRHRFAVPSYRDHRNPELMHFPGSLGTKILIVAAESLFGVLLGAGLFTGPAGERARDSMALLVVMLLVALLWPRHLSIDQHGIRMAGFFGIGKTRIPWSDLDPPADGREMLHARWMERLGIRGRTLVFRSRVTGARVVHTPRHPDRARLLRELERRGVAGSGAR